MTQNPPKKTESPPYITHDLATKNLFEYSDLYSDADIQAICERHGISFEDHGRVFGAVLDFAAKRYASLKYRESIELSPSETGRHLTSLRRGAKELAAEIGRLPPASREVFDKAENELQLELENRLQEVSIQHEKALPSRMEQAGTGSFMVIHDAETTDGWQGRETRMEYVAFRDIENALKQLQMICETGIGYLQPQKGGRPENKAMQVWTGMLSDFWAKDLKRAYRVDGYKGEVVSDAGDFLTDCLKHLDPTAIDQLYSQMRRYLETMPRKKP